jgi:hypothetical protein
MKFRKVSFLFALLVCATDSKKAPSAASIRKHEARRVAEKQHEINENIKKFHETLESLRTTVDFEPVAL